MKKIIALALFLSAAAFAQDGATRTLVSSWYGPSFHGRLTASGEIYDMHALTFAHRTMAFGTRVLLVNPENGRSIIARCQDRGPYFYDSRYRRWRDLDVSFAVAQHLMMVERGVVELYVRPLTIAIPKVGKED